MRILIVDDHLDTLAMLAMFLDLGGHRVRQATSVAEAKRWLQNEPVDLVITDYCMPGEDGLCLLDYCHARYPTLPVAVVTAYGDDEAMREGYRRGAFSWLEKPIDHDALERLIAQAEAAHLPPGPEQSRLLTHVTTRLAEEFVAGIVTLTAALR